MKFLVWFEEIGLEFLFGLKLVEKSYIIVIFYCYFFLVWVEKEIWGCVMMEVILFLVCWVV